jgi:hypothetical protein
MLVVERGRDSDGRLEVGNGLLSLAFGMTYEDAVTLADLKLFPEVREESSCLGCSSFRGAELAVTSSHKVSRTRQEHQRLSDQITVPSLSAQFQGVNQKLLVLRVVSN